VNPTATPAAISIGSPGGLLATARFKWRMKSFQQRSATWASSEALSGKCR